MSTPLPACNLSPSKYAAVTAAYAAAASHYAATADLTGDHALIDVRGPKAPIKALLDAMIARESGCCAHFQFVVTEIADGYRVEMTVPSAPNVAAVTLRRAVAAFFPSAKIAEVHGDRLTDQVEGRGKLKHLENAIDLRSGIEEVR